MWSSDGASCTHFLLPPEQEGKVKVTNISAGNVKYEDTVIGPGGYAGERAIMTGEKRAADLIAETDGLAFVIDKDTFATVFGDLEDVLMRALDKQRLVSPFSLSGEAIVGASFV